MSGAGLSSEVGTAATTCAGMARKRECKVAASPSHTVHMRNTVLVWKCDTRSSTTHTRKFRGTRKKFIRPARVASGMCWPLRTCVIIMM